MLNNSRDNNPAPLHDSTEGLRVARYEWGNRPAMVARGAAFLMRAWSGETSETCEQWFARQIGNYAATRILTGRAAIGAADNRRAVYAHFWAACEQRLYRQHGAIE